MYIYFSEIITDHIQNHAIKVAECSSSYAAICDPRSFLSA